MEWTLANHLRVGQTEVEMRQPLICVLVLGACSGQARTPSRFEAKACGATASMPALPQYSAQTKSTTEGTTTLHQARAVSGTVIYGLTCGELASGASFQGNLDQAQEGFLRANAATVVTTKELSLAGHAGREITAVGKALHFRVRFFVLPGRIVAVSATGLEEAVMAAPVTAFLESLTLPRVGEQPGT